MTIGEFCTREVVITERGTGIVELAQLMRRHHVGDVVVIEKRGDLVIPVGIITDRDLVMELIAAQVDLDSVTSGDVMSPVLVTAEEKEGIWDTLQCMHSKGIRRMPVVNEDGGLEGILTVDDLIDLLAEELALLTKIAGRGQTLEEERRE
jgi:CBS domain-containing protein